MHYIYSSIDYCCTLYVLYCTSYYIVYLYIYVYTYTYVHIHSDEMCLCVYMRVRQCVPRVYPVIYNVYSKGGTRRWSTLLSRELFPPPATVLPPNTPPTTTPNTTTTAAAAAAAAAPDDPRLSGRVSAETESHGHYRQYFGRTDNDSGCCCCCRSSCYSLHIADAGITGKPVWHKVRARKFLNKQRQQLTLKFRENVTHDTVRFGSGSPAELPALGSLWVRRSPRAQHCSPKGRRGGTRDLPMKHAVPPLCLKMQVLAVAIWTSIPASGRKSSSASTRRTLTQTLATSTSSSRLLRRHQSHLPTRRKVLPVHGLAAGW